MDEEVEPIEQETEELNQPEGSESILIDLPHTIRIALTSSRYDVVQLSNLSLELKDILLKLKKQNGGGSYLG